MRAKTCLVSLHTTSETSQDVPGLEPELPAPVTCRVTWVSDILGLCVRPCLIQNNNIQCLRGCRAHQQSTRWATE